MLSEQDQMMLEGLYWWDIPTLFRCPLERDPGNCDIALVGVPHSTGNGTTERDRHLGPRAVRDISAMSRRVHTQFELDPWSRCRIRGKAGQGKAGPKEKRGKAGQRRFSPNRILDSVSDPVFPPVFPEVHYPG